MPSSGFFTVVTRKNELLINFERKFSSQSTLTLSYLTPLLGNLLRGLFEICRDGEREIEFL